MFKKEDYQHFPNKSGIYKITTLHNNLFYIGSALSLSKRMKDHRNDLKRNQCHVSRLQKIFNKYGEDDFIVSFLEIYDKRFELNSQEHKGLLKKEEELIQSLKPKYNTILTPTKQVNNPSTSKKIYQYDLEGKFIKEWNSGREVLRQLGIQVQNGLKNASSGGFQWSYKKIENIGKYRRLSGVRKKIIVIEEDRVFSSIMEYVEYLKGNRKTYQNIAYAIKVGKKFCGKTVRFC
jgi:group I intron endonuclease